MKLKMQYYVRAQQTDESRKNNHYGDAFEKKKKREREMTLRHMLEGVDEYEVNKSCLK